MSDLKPCPFCGGEGIEKHSRGLAFIVQCAKCKAATDLERCHADAISAWNTRALPRQDGLREALEKAAGALELTAAYVRDTGQKGTAQGIENDAAQARAALAESEKK